MSSSIVGDYMVEYDALETGGMKMDSTRVLFPDGSNYTFATGRTELRSPDISFTIKKRRQGLSAFLLGQWEKVADIKNGAGWAGGDMRILIRGGS